MNLTYLKNIFYREPSLIFKEYLYGKESPTTFDYIFMADGKMLHGGLFDRIKGAISIFSLSKVANKRFGIYFVVPFCLAEYLKPNIYDWYVTEKDLLYHYPQSRPIVAYSENENIERLLKGAKGQTHFYYGDDIVGIVNNRFGCHHEWAALFHELFKPSMKLENYLSHIKSDIGSRYFTIHVRFLNLLGDHIENNRYRELNYQGKKDLMNKCIKKVRELISLNEGDKLRPVLLSDSTTFIDRIKSLIPSAYIVPGRIVHIDKVKYTNDEDNFKLFSDIYMIAGAQRAYSIVGEELYSSAFPEYSAKIGNCPFFRVSL